MLGSTYLEVKSLVRSKRKDGQAIYGYEIQGVRPFGCQSLFSEVFSLHESRPLFPTSISSLKPPEPPPGGSTGILTLCTRTLQLVNGGFQLCFDVEKATCFKWLQHEDLLRSPVQSPSESPKLRRAAARRRSTSLAPRAFSLGASRGWRGPEELNNEQGPGLGGGRFKLGFIKG